MEKKNQNISKLKIFDVETSHLTSQKDREKNYVAKGEQKKREREKKSCSRFSICRWQNISKYMRGESDHKAISLNFFPVFTGIGNKCKFPV